MRMVTVLLVGTVCAVDCSRDNRDVRPLRVHDAAVQGSAAVVGLPVDAGPRPDLMPGGQASTWNRGNELVRRMIRRCAPQVRACYDAELIDNPGLDGRINVRFTVGREGRVTTAAVGASTLRNPTLETCLVDVVKLCRFANPVDRRPVDLSYTFEFGPSKSNDGT
jgi:outer membrane biosynthesis protein TonB